MTELRAAVVLRAKGAELPFVYAVQISKNVLDDYLKVGIDVDKIHEILDKEKGEKEAKEKSQSE